MKTDSSLYTQSRTWLAIAVGILMVSIARGIREPGNWAYTHFLFNYEQGFTKRALIGEIFRQTAIPYSYSHTIFLVFSIAIFLIVILMLLRNFHSLLRHENIALTSCVLLYASSMSPVYLAHTIGYFDLIGMAAALAIIAIRNPAVKRRWAIPVTVLCLFIHESFFIIFMPSIFCSILISNKNILSSRQLITQLSAYAIVATVIALFLANATLPPDTAHALQALLESKSGQTLRWDGFSVLMRHISDNYAITGGSFSSAWFYLDCGASLLVTLPTSVWLIITSWKMLKPQLGSPVAILACAASLSPFLMHILAWDTHRWNALIVATSFLNLCSTVQTCEPAESSPRIYPALVLLLFLNGASTIGLFEAYQVRAFPFIDDILATLLASHASTP